jgi:ATP-dependent Clp protease ATP-binding subunit ClpC
MFERFTEQAKQVVVLAHVEARLLGHDHIAIEHLLLGLATERDGLAARILEGRELTPESIRDAVVARAGAKDGVSPASLPFDEGATRVVEHAVREADAFGQHSVGSEHLLLGIARETDGVGARVLAQFGLDEDKIRVEVVRMLAGPGARLEAFIAQSDVEPEAGAPLPATATPAPPTDFPDVELLSESDLDLLIDRLTVAKERVAKRQRWARHRRVDASAERDRRRLHGPDRDV